MKVFFHVFLAIILLVGAVFSTLAKNTLPGNYTCEGYDPFQKSNYKATGTITKTNETYRFDFHSDTDKNVVYQGTGVLSKEDPTILSMVCTSPQEPNMTAVALYKIKPDGTLHAIWTVHGKETLATETCKKI